MATKIKLQEPFSYSLVFLIVLIALILLPVIIYLTLRVVEYVKSRQRSVVKKTDEEKIIIYDLEICRKEYSAKIDMIAANYSMGKLPSRKAYIELSAAVREFVTKVTGVKASNFSLNEIRANCKPDLYILIEKFYQPEFAKDEANEGFDRAINEARRVVLGWN